MFKGKRAIAPHQGREENTFQRLMSALANFTHSQVKESVLPAEIIQGYRSNVGYYGGRVGFKLDGKLVYDTTGTISRIDRRGDVILRTFDEHVVKRPGRMLLTHPHRFFQFLAPGPLRRRGNPAEIVDNAQRLGLGAVYTLHPQGVEIQRPEIFTQGIALQDIYQSGQPTYAEQLKPLQTIDRFQALAEAARYVRQIHDTCGAIGELVVQDILFQKRDKGEQGDVVTEPILNLPDLIYNPKKYIPESAKKATDLLDFMTSVSFEELQRTGNWEQVKQVLITIVENYGDEHIIRIVRSFAQRGRLTMLGDADKLPNTATKKVRAFFAMHNKARLAFDAQQTQAVREQIISITDKVARGNR